MQDSSVFLQSKLKKELGTDLTGVVRLLLCIYIRHRQRYGPIGSTRWEPRCPRLCPANSKQPESNGRFPLAYYINSMIAHISSSIVASVDCNRMTLSPKDCLKCSDDKEFEMSEIFFYKDGAKGVDIQIRHFLLR